MAVFTLAQQAGQALHIGLSTDTKPDPVAGQMFLATDTGQTFAGNGSAWMAVLKNVTVAALSDFPTPSGGIITLADDTAYFIAGAVDIGSNRIVCGTRNILRGFDRSNDKLTSTTTGAMFTCDSSSTVKTILTLEGLTLTCAGGSLVSMTGTGSNTQNLVLISCTVAGMASLGTLASCTAVVIRNSTILGPITTGGFTITGSGVGGTFLVLRDNSFRGCAGTMFALGTSVWAEVLISRNIITTAAGETFVSGTTGGANVTVAGQINNNVFTGAGTFVSVLTRSDAGWIWSNNTGIANTAAFNTQHSLTGGGDLTAERTLSLVNDSASPGAGRYYGTDAGGVRGFFALPSGGSGAGAVGTTTINFGAFPGSTDTSVNVTGQASIVAGSIVRATKRLVATADHSADEHFVEEMDVEAGNISAGVGFTIYARTRNRPLYGQWTIAWSWE